MAAAVSLGQRGGRIAFRFTYHERMPPPAASSHLTLVITATGCLPASLAMLANASEPARVWPFQFKHVAPSPHVSSLRARARIATINRSRPALIRSISLVCFSPSAPCTELPPFLPSPTTSSHFVAKFRSSVDVRRNQLGAPTFPSPGQALPTVDFAFFPSSVESAAVLKKLGVSP